MFEEELERQTEIAERKMDEDEIKEELEEYEREMEREQKKLLGTKIAQIAAHIDEEVRKFRENLEKHMEGQLDALKNRLERENSAKREQRKQALWRELQQRKRQEEEELMRRDKEMDAQMSEEDKVNAVRCRHGIEIKANYLIYVQYLADGNGKTRKATNRKWRRRHE